MWGSERVKARKELGFFEGLGFLVGLWLALVVLLPPL